MRNLLRIERRDPGRYQVLGVLFEDYPAQEFAFLGAFHLGQFLRLMAQGFDSYPPGAQCPADLDTTPVMLGPSQ